MFRYVANQLCLEKIKSVVNSASTPHAKLHKRHNALSFHRVRDAIVFRVVVSFHLSSEETPAELMSKHWGHKSAWPLLLCLLFWKGDTIKMKN